MNKENIILIKEFFNYNHEVNNMRRINIIICIWFASALNLTVLIFCVNSPLGKGISIMFCLIAWFIGVGYGFIHHRKKDKELIKHRNKIRKLLK